jgi:hypothetical protein
MNSALKISLDQLVKNLNDGWSINASLSRAGINQHVHSALLKEPEYKKIIDKHRQIRGKKPFK